MNIELKQPIVYVTRDIERAMGMEPRDGYYIVSNDTRYGRIVQARFPDNISLINDNRGALDTYELLLLPEIEKLISDRGAAVLVFQNTARIERLVSERGWKLINPSAEIARRSEEKISQIEFLKEDASLLPPHKVTVMSEVGFSGQQFVLQFNHSHTGEGTYVIDSIDKLETLKAKFPKRDCRVVEFIDGPIFTVNAGVDESAIFVGNPSYQITGLSEFTDLPFSTVGNDWSLPRLPQYKKMLADIDAIAQRVGNRLKEEGWRGLFGIDVVWDETTQKTYLLEINARQAASAAYESALQSKAAPEELTIFERHVASLLGLPSSGGMAEIASGSQIVKRVTEAKTSVDVQKLLSRGLSVIEYETDIHNKELFRIQSDKGIMEAHEILNELGTFIASCIK